MHCPYCHQTLTLVDHWFQCNYNRISNNVIEHHFHIFNNSINNSFQLRFPFFNSNNKFVQYFIGYSRVDNHFYIAEGAKLLLKLDEFEPCQSMELLVKYLKLKAYL